MLMHLYHLWLFMQFLSKTDFVSVFVCQPVTIPPCVGYQPIKGSVPYLPTPKSQCYDPTLDNYSLTHAFHHIPVHVIDGQNNENESSPL